MQLSIGFKFSHFCFKSNDGLHKCSSFTSYKLDKIHTMYSKNNKTMESEDDSFAI